MMNENGELSIDTDAVLLRRAMGGDVMSAKDGEVYVYVWMPNDDPYGVLNDEVLEDKE